VSRLTDYVLVRHGVRTIVMHRTCHQQVYASRENQVSTVQDIIGACDEHRCTGPAQRRNDIEEQARDYLASEGITG